jgi:S-DNA-T family DNA segregation ATPase FtsK/SpoIIIE
MDDSRVLLLAVATGSGERRDISVETGDDVSPDEFESAIGHHIGAPPGTVRLVRSDTQVPLADASSMVSLGLAQGELLTAVDGGHVRSTPQTVLTVDSGPASGASYELTPGAHVVGREIDCAIQVADPSLSRHHVVVRVVPDGVVVTDAGSTNGTYVDGRRLGPGEEAVISEASVVRAGRSEMSIRPWSPVRRPPGDATGHIGFNRPPRFVRPLQAPALTLDAPPEVPGRVRLPLLASLLPIVLGVVLWLLTGSVLMLAFTALSPLMAAGSYVEDRRGGKRHFGERSAAFRGQLADVERRLKDEVEREAAHARTASPATSLLVRRAHDLLPELWERRDDDVDFLALRVGTATRPASARVELGPGGAESLRQEALGRLARLGALDSVPVTVPLREVGGLGVVGGAAGVDALVRSLAVQAATLHSPRDLVVVAAVSSDAATKWDWLMWLPHARTRSVDLTHTLAVGSRSVSSLVEELAALVRERRRVRVRGSAVSTVRRMQHVIAFVDENAISDRVPLAQLLADAPEAGVTVVWIGTASRSLPNGCRVVLELDPHVASLSVFDTRTGETVSDVLAEGVPPGVAADVARDLAPLVDVGGGRGNAQLPTEVGLLTLLEARTLTPEWLSSRWESEGSGRRVVLGVAAQGAYAPDIRRDGPHALVAGTTGSGKSELLQTLVASLALTYPPDRLTLLLVDYKGGAAFKDCMKLPHTVGVVTDLDGHLAQRALVSLDAELRAREALLRECGAKDLEELTRTNPRKAPPDLVIVIDEFATLAKEVPEFVSGVVDVAQRGRSLGLHLVLATQRPGGSVTESIRANTNLRIALRVSEPGESSDVLGSDVAARIRGDQRGRAFSRVGQSEPVEFQAAYVGGVSRLGARTRSVIVSDFRMGDTQVDGDRTLVAASATDLSRIVTAVHECWRGSGRPDPRRPWLPPLEAVVRLETLDGLDRQNGRIVPLGVLDEPGKQRQMPLAVDLETDGSILVFGASGSGKTTLLRTVAAALASRTRPEDVQLYGLDFATRGLVSLESLPHVGSVIPADEPALVERLFAMLRRELTRRKVLLAEAGASTLSSYLAMDEREALARIVVLLDGYAGFHATFEKVDLGALVDVLPRLVSEGRPLGIHLVIAADRRAAIPASLLGLIGRRLVLRLADADEYSALGIDPRLTKGAFLPAGRGFMDGTELQVAVVGETPSAEEQVKAVQRLGTELHARHGASVAPPIRALPERVRLESLPDPTRPLESVIGMNDDDLHAVPVSLQDGHFSVIGPYRSGRSTALQAVVTSLARGPRKTTLVLLAPRRSPLTELAVWDVAASGVDECATVAQGLVDTLESGASTAHGATIVFVDDAEELAEGPAAAGLETLARRGRDIDVVLVTATERQAAQRAYGWLRDVRKDEHGLLLDPDVDIDGDMLGVRLPRRTNVVFPPGRGYLVKRGDLALIQIASA